MRSAGPKTVCHHVHFTSRRQSSFLSFECTETNGVSRCASTRIRRPAGSKPNTRTPSTDSMSTERCSFSDFTTLVLRGKTAVCTFYTLLDLLWLLLLLLFRYVAASCATEQVPPRLRSGREERPVLR